MQGRVRRAADMALERRRRARERWALAEWHGRKCEARTLRDACSRAVRRMNVKFQRSALKSWIYFTSSALSRRENVRLGPLLFISLHFICWKLCISKNRLAVSRCHFSLNSSDADVSSMGLETRFQASESKTTGMSSMNKRIYRFWSMWFSLVLVYKRIRSDRNLISNLLVQKRLRAFFGPWKSYTSEHERIRLLIIKKWSERSYLSSQAALGQWHEFARYKKIKARKSCVADSRRRKKLLLQLFQILIEHTGLKCIISQVWIRFHRMLSTVCNKSIKFSNVASVKGSKRSLQKKIRDLARNGKLHLHLQLWIRYRMRQRHRIRISVSGNMVENHKRISFVWSVWRLRTLVSVHISSKSMIQKLVVQLLSKQQSAGSESRQIGDKHMEIMERLLTLVKKITFPPFAVALDQYETYFDSKIPCLSVLAQIAVPQRKGFISSSPFKHGFYHGTVLSRRRRTTLSPADDSQSVSSNLTGEGIHISAKPAIISVQQNQISVVEKQAGNESLLVTSEAKDNFSNLSVNRNAQITHRLDQVSNTAARQFFPDTMQTAEQQDTDPSAASKSPQARVSSSLLKALVSPRVRFDLGPSRSAPSAGQALGIGRMEGFSSLETTSRTRAMKTGIMPGGGGQGDRPVVYKVSDPNGRAEKVSALEAPSYGHSKALHAVFGAGGSQNAAGEPPLVVMLSSPVVTSRHSALFP